MNATLKKLVSEFHLNSDFLFFTTISVVGSGFTAFSPLIIAKLLNPAGFGSYSLGMAVVFLLCAIFVFSSQTPCIISANVEFKKTGKINYTFTILLGIVLITSFLALVIVTLFGNTLTEFTHYSSSFLPISIFFAFLGYNVKTAAQTILLGIDKKKSSAVIEAIFGLSTVILILMLYAFRITDLFFIFLVYFPAGLLTIIFAKFLVKKDDVVPIKFNNSSLKEIIHFSSWQIIGLSAIYFVNWGDNFVLRLYVHTDQIGIYNLAYKLFGGILTITYFVNSYFLPFLSQRAGDKSALANYLYLKRPKIFLMMLVCIAISLLVIPVLIHLVYGQIFIAAIPIYAILSIALVFFAYSVFFIPLFNALHRYKIIQICAVAQIFVNILFDFLLIPLLGIYGSAIATVLGYVTIFILYEWYFKTKTKREFL